MSCLHMYIFIYKSAIVALLLRQLTDSFVLWHCYCYYILLLFLYCCQFTLQGVLGIKVKIMLDWDPKGKQGPMTPLPDLVTIHPPKEEEEFVPAPMIAAPAIEVSPMA